jgi:4-hydroxybenzoate polyprenyltransferase
MRWFLVGAVSLLGMAVILALAPGGDVLALTLGLCGAWAFGWHLASQLRRLDIDNSDQCLKLFRSNRNAGLIPALFLALAAFV